jgi:environmental stress-induced protein Ves
MTEFDGEIATECELLDGACTDLNLMVARSVRGVRAWVERLLEPRPLRPALRGTVLAFAISGIVTIEQEHREATCLQAWDVAVMPPDEGGSIGAAGLDAAAAPLVFFAALDDNPP